MTDFKTLFIKRLSQKKWDEFEKVVRKMMTDAVSEYKGSRRCILDMIPGCTATIRPNVNDSDYCQAFGIVQGVAYYALGYKWMGADNEAGTPKNWIRTIEEEVGAEAYEIYLKNKARAQTA